MNNAGSVGVASQSAIYSALIISSLFLPTLLIKRFGCKAILVACMLTYSPYIAANFHPTMSTLLPTAILLGAGGANLWTAASAYINELSFIDAGGDTAKAALSTSRYFGIFVMFFQTTQIWGNLVSFYVLSPSSSVSEIYQNASANGSRDALNEKISCGADFCGGIDQALSPIPDRQKSTLIGIYFAFSVIAALVLLIFLDPLKQNDKGNGDSSLLQKLAATFNQIKKTEQLLLVILTTFIGLEEGFIFADYSEVSHIY